MYKLRFAVGFLAGLLALGYGLFESYDQVRLGLAFGGAGIIIIIVIEWGSEVEDNARLKKLHPYEIEKLRPDLQIVSKETPPASTVLSLEERFPQFANTKTVDHVTCVRCNLYVPPGTGKEDRGIIYHRDCYQALYPHGVV